MNPEAAIVCLSPVGLLQFLQRALETVFLPVVAAVLAYVVVDRIGEWRRRKMSSGLGVVIIESLLEEVRTGIQIMQNTLVAIEDDTSVGPPPGLFPHESWSGMLSIPDDVLLRIVETSRGRRFEGFPPRECRSHCKNYFTHMAENYRQVWSRATRLAQEREDWRPELKALLLGPGQPYIEAATGVERMLENIRQLLEGNSRRVFPK
jgi:hypothetical protein